MAKAEIMKQTAEGVGGNIKQSAWMGVLESIATVILGIFLIVWPETALKVISYVLGVFFVLKGAYQIFNYFITKGQNNFFDNSLLAGVVSLLVGIAALVMGGEIANVFRIVIGILIIYEALVRMNTALKLHSARIDAWKYTLILGLSMLVIGIFVTFYAGAVISLVGWMMVLTGVIGIVSDVVFVQYINELIAKLTGGKKNE